VIIRHFDIKKPLTRPPENEGWEPTWHGYFEMTKCLSPSRRREIEDFDNAIRAKGLVPEVDFEQDCLLSILADIKRETVNMFEVGAGWGRMCLALAGVINYKLLPVIPHSYRCLAVEAEPTHYRWLKETFTTQNIVGIPEYGAVSSKSGTCHFNIVESPDSQYGQTMTPVFNRYKIPSLGVLSHILQRKAIKVPTYTVDELIKKHGFDHVDIIDVDVQGAEYEVVLGAEDSIKNGMIDYWLIGTHHPRLNEALLKLLSPEFELVVNILPDTIARIEGFAPIQTHDGIQLYRRKRRDSTD
jgi:FkbM family methyltransferase